MGKPRWFISVRTRGWRILMTQLIETSLISAHFANQSNTTYLDVFSCKAYDPKTVADFSKKFFKPGK